MIKPRIVPVPEKMEKFYGKGQMLHPELTMITELIELIPAGMVATIDDLAMELAMVYGADVTCPMRTTNHLKKLAKSDSNIPFWRILKEDYSLVKMDRYEYWATVLEREGFSLGFKEPNLIKVLVGKDQLFRFRKGHQSLGA